MKRLRLQLSLILAGCLVLTCSLDGSTQGQQQDGKKVVDSYATAVTAVYPAAGAVFKATAEMLDMFGYFSHPDPVGDAIKLINQRLDVLERRVSDLETRMRALENELFRTQNMSRVRLLRSKQDSLKLLAFKLAQKPAEKRERQALAKEADIIANGFLEDPDLWKWSDLNLNDNKMSAPDFKPLPALEYYFVTLVTLMAAIDNAADGDYEYANREYGRDLKKHIEYLTVRAGWRQEDEEVTLPESVRKRITCTMEVVHLSPRNRVCQIHEWCTDVISRELTTIDMHEVLMPVGAELCNIPPNLGRSSTAAAPGTDAQKLENPLESEQELERKYGVELMARLAEKLELLRTTGSARESFIGTFDASTQAAEYLYGVKPNGELLWYRHRIVTRKTGVPSSPTQDSPTAPKKRHDFPGGNIDARIKLPDERGTFATSKVTHALEGPKRVGTGWEGFIDIEPAGLSGIYTVRPDGKLLWYRHDGFLDGTMNWSNYKEIGRGWNDLKQIIPMGDGIIYTLAKNGNLEWRRHVGYLDGRGLESPGAWEGPKLVGTGWGDFKFVFAGGEGVMYAITNNGELRWYRNKNFMTGVREWEGPNIVGTGWESFKKVFSTGEGVIYAMKPTGELIWYKHEGYKDGTKRWQAPVQIAADWSEFIFVFPRMKGTYVPPVVR